VVKKCKEDTMMDGKMAWASPERLGLSRQ
jgi:hypothetical protein